MPERRLAIATLALAVGVAVGASSLVASVPARAAAPSTSWIRVNQVGYVASAPKRAFLLSTEPCAGTPFDLDDGGSAVTGGTAGADRGPWNAAYPHVCAIDFDGFATPGTYTLAAAGAVSPPFAIDTAANLYAPLLDDALVFYRAQRDGADVDPSVLARKPAHLHDRHASVYRIPRYKGETLQGDLARVGGPVDVAGGWFDAGDFIKFTGTTSFTVAVMLSAVRDHPSLFEDGGGPAFRAEARHGLAWLMKMWNDRRRVLYYQVGIGSGNAQVLADHDLWRLPQKDDAMTQHARRYLAHRPVFRSAPPGAKVPPSLAGRLAAVFGLCAQVWAGTPLAARCLRSGQHVFDLAKTSRVGTQVTASPVDYYREDEWRDDLEFGAVELYLGLSGPSAPPPASPHASPRYYLRQAARWADAYIHGPGDGADTFNLYDTSGLAHAELIGAMGATPGLAVSKGDLLRDLRTQLEPRRTRSASDPFNFGAYRWDAVPHTFGLVSEALAYDAATGTQRYANLARHQLDWALGANAWGSSFVVGAGTTFPHCMQHVVANLVGSTDGTPPLLLGATVDGPNGYVPGTGFFDNAVPCPAGGADPFRPFNIDGWRYVDRVSSWSTVEPTLDYTALSFLAFTRMAAS